MSCVFLYCLRIPYALRHVLDKFLCVSSVSVDVLMCLSYLSWDVLYVLLVKFIMLLCCSSFSLDFLYCLTIVLSVWMLLCLFFMLLWVYDVWLMFFVVKTFWLSYVSLNIIMCALMLCICVFWMLIWCSYVCPDVLMISWCVSDLFLNVLLI